MYSTKQTIVLELFSGAYILFVYLVTFCCILSSCVFKAVEVVARVLWYTGQSIGFRLKSYLESQNESQSRTTNKINQSRFVFKDQRVAGSGCGYPKIPGLSHKNRGAARYTLPKKREYDTNHTIRGNSWTN